MNSTHPWGLKATKVALDGRIFTANRYRTGATSQRSQDEFLPRGWFITGPSSPKRENSSKRKESGEHEHCECAANIGFGWPGGEKSLVQGVGLADLPFNPR